MPRPLRPELRNQLLEAAAREFGLSGYARASVAGIAEQLGVSKGSVYFHFRGKLELFLAALDRLERQRDAALAACPPPAHAAAALRGLLLAELGFHWQHPELRRLQSILDTELRGEASVALRGGLRDALRRLRDDLRRLVQDALHEGRTRPTDPATEAFRLAACLSGTLLQRRAGDVAQFFEPAALVGAWLSPLILKARRRGSLEGGAQSEREGEDFRPAF